MNEQFDDHIGDALQRATAGVQGHGPGFGDVRRRVRHRRRVQTTLTAVPVVAVGGLVALRHSPVVAPLHPGLLGTPTTFLTGVRPPSDCFVLVETTLSPWDPALSTTTDVATDVTLEQTSINITEVSESPTSSYPTNSTDTTETRQLPTTTVPSFMDGPTTTVVASAETTIPCEPAHPVLNDGGMPTTTVICAEQVASRPCFPPSTILPRKWESRLELFGIDYRLAPDPDGLGICTHFNGTSAGCDSDVAEFGTILHVLRSADASHVLVFGAALPGVEVQFEFLDASTGISTVYGDGDWRIAWAILLPADVMDHGTPVVRIYPYGEAGSSSPTMFFTVPIVVPSADDMSTLEVVGDVPGEATSTSVSTTEG